MSCSLFKQNSLDKISLSKYLYLFDVSILVSSILIDFPMVGISIKLSISLSFTDLLFFIEICSFKKLLIIYCLNN